MTFLSIYFFGIDDAPFSLPHIFLFNFKVLASQTRIYIILELGTGGELFDKIVRFLL
jgi:hypothetical protein